MTTGSYPCLRAIQIDRIDHRGPALLLRDPLQLAGGSVVVPQAYGPLLAALDGQASYGELRAILARQLGATRGPAVLDELLLALDQAFLLENEHFQEAYAAALHTYRSAPYRPLSSTTNSAADLRTELDAALQHAPSRAPYNEYRAIYSPHIDYARGATVYAEIWKQAAESARRADLVIMLATDHYSSQPLTLTRQRYATPYGGLETDQRLIDTLAEAIGPHAFAAELYHTREHSVELVANWLHHVRSGVPCVMVPILCGSFYQYTQQAVDPLSSPALDEFVQVLRQISAEREPLIVISGDLAHVGPAFGDPALNEVGEQQLFDDDQAILARMRAGDPAGLLATIRDIRDRNKICGLPPSYLALAALGNIRGEQHGYLRCPADSTNTSAVTIAGFAFA